jgi:hypothetical protein
MICRRQSPSYYEWLGDSAKATESWNQAVISAQLGVRRRGGMEAALHPSSRRFALSRLGSLGDQVGKCLRLLTKESPVVTILA